MNITIPSPGSEEAGKLGCECPVIDNHYGKGFYHPNSPEDASFWISGNCKLHKT